MESPRLPRFKRSAAVAPIQITERDQAIIRHVHRNRFLRSSHIVALVGGSPQQLVRRLQLLYHHGFLERPRAQLDYYHEGGSHSIVYGLGTKGAAIMQRELAPSFRRVRPGEDNRSVGRVFLEHALLVSDVKVAVELACRKSGRIRFLSEEELMSLTGKHHQFRWKVNASSHLRLGVIPDRAFGLEFPDRNGRNSRAVFFLEADRGTMPVTRRDLSQTSFFRKMLAYEATWSQSIHRTRFGFHRFRVLTVTTSTERVQTLIRACSQLKRGHGLFLFADRTILEKPEDILSSVWLTGKSGETGSLLD